MYILFTHIRGVGDELSEEDLLVGVEGVNDQRHQLSNLSLESEGLHILLHCGAGFLWHLQKKWQMLHFSCRNIQSNPCLCLYMLRTHFSNNVQEIENHKQSSLDPCYQLLKVSVSKMGNNNN